MPSADLQRQIVELTGIVHELVETERDQAKELRRLTQWLEQQTDLRDAPEDLSVEASRLSALLRRVTVFRSEIEGGNAEP